MAEEKPDKHISPEAKQFIEKFKDKPKGRRHEDLLPNVNIKPTPLPDKRPVSEQENEA